MQYKGTSYLPHIQINMHAYFWFTQCLVCRIDVWRVWAHKYVQIQRHVGRPLGRHIIHQIDRHAEPHFLVVVPDLYGRQRRRRRRKRVRRHHPEPHIPSHIDILYIKIIIMPSPTSWWRSRTSTTDDADAGDENVPIGSIPGPRNHPIYTYYT